MNIHAFTIDPFPVPIPTDDFSLNGVPNITLHSYPTLSDKKDLKREAKETEKQSNALLERVVEASSPAVIAAYEKKIEALERQKLLIAEKLANLTPPQGRFEQVFELAWKSLSSPWKIWALGDLTHRKTVLRLAFTEQLTYDRKSGYRTPKTFLPFNMLEEVAGSACKMVRPGGESSNSLLDTLEEWENHLASTDLIDLRCEDDEFAP